MELPDLLDQALLIAHDTGQRVLAFVLPSEMYADYQTRVWKETGEKDVPLHHHGVRLIEDPEQKPGTVEPVYAVDDLPEWVG